MRRLKRALGVWDAFWFSAGSASTLGTCRLLFFGALFLWQLPHDYSAWGGYSSAFWMPIWLFDTLGLPPFSPFTIGWMQAAWKATLFLSAIGLFARPAMVLAFALGIYLMGLPHNFGQTQHFDTLVVFAAGALALSRAADACSLDALLASALRGRTAPADAAEYTWPIRFVHVMMALIFCAAGISKLRHSGLEWVFSDNLSLLLLRQQYHLSDGEPLTRWGVSVANHVWASRGLAAVSVMVETTFPLALFSRRARYVLVPAGLSFLAGIRLLMGPTFEQFMICYVFWIPWSRLAAMARERIAAVSPERLVLNETSCGMCARTVRVLTRLDCFDRLDFRDLKMEWPRLCDAVRPPDVGERVITLHRIVDRGNDSRQPCASIVSGFDAYRSIAWVLPIAWPVLPVLYVPGVRWLGRRLDYLIAPHRPAAPAVSAAAAGPR